jgi:hypothetical protein
MKARIKSKSNTFNVLWNYIKIVVNRKKNHLEKKQINLAKAKELKLMDSKECCGLDE